MEFRCVHSLDEALEQLEALGGEARVLAGGTDVMVQLQRGELEAGCLLHIERLRELDYVHVDGHAALGALTSHRALAASEALAPYRSLRQGANLVGGWQTQIAGTIGGNVCNASPAADTVPALLVHGARVHLQSQARGPRELPLETFIEGRRRTARAPDELLTRLELEPVPARSADAYLKVGRRGAMEIAVAGLAVRITLDGDGETVAEARIALCSVGPRVYRATEVEALLRGSRADARALAEAGEALVRSSDAIDDVRGSQRYRERVLPRVLGKVVGECVERARSGREVR